MGKIFILDTSVLLEDPNAIFAFHNSEVVIPTVVLEEIDRKKRFADDIGRNAREISRTLDKLRGLGKLQEGIKLENDITLRVELNHRHLESIKGYFHEINNDNRILAVAKNLADDKKINKKGKEVVLVSKDVLVRIKADTLGLIARDYMPDKIIDTSDKYIGYLSININPLLIDSFYKENYLDLDKLPLSRKDLVPNQFLILKDELGTSKSGLAYFDPLRNVLVNLKNSERDVWGIHPRNAQQKMGMELLLNDNIPLVTLTGRAGTGKTLLALVAGLFKTEELSLYKKLLVARPIVPMGKDIGYLPGDKNEKLRPWMQPIYDNMEFIFSNRQGTIDGILAGLKKVEIEALTFIRGRTIPNQFIIIDEAQNLTKHEIKTIVSRVGEGSKIVLVGDPEQIDHPYMDSTNNGLSYLIDKFKDYKEAGHVTFKKGERSTLAQLAAEIL